MWVARDKNGALTLFMYKPIRIDDFWCQDDDTSWTTFDLDSDCFPNLKWEDEPIEIELISKSELTSLKMLSALYREEHSENLFSSEEDDGRSCTNCKFKNNYPKCYKSDNNACDDWMLAPRMHKIDCVTNLKRMKG